MKKFLITGLFMLCGSSFCFPQPTETLGDKIRRAFSLVGRWEIIKMEIDRSETVNNPNTVPEASLARVNVTVRSDLGSYGSFTVAPGGGISGSGEAVYQFRVGAGTTAISLFNVSLPIGAAAMMNNDNGIRQFTVTGTANLSSRTISLNAFQPQGAPLNMIIRPGGSTFTSVLWPPMTNIAATKVIVTGSSLLLRASGVLSGIKVYFEAVKYVDLAGLFTDFEQYIETRITTAINNSTTNNNTNTNPANNNNTNPSTDSAGGGSGNGGALPLVAGTVTVATGSSALVTFRTPQVSADYAISLTPMDGSNNSPVVTFSDKTVSGFRIHVKGTGNAPVKIDWVVVPYRN